MGSSIFDIGDVLVASPSAAAQGFVPGALYEVRDTAERPLPFGLFVTYFLVPVGAPVGAPEQPAGNAHLLFSKAPAGAEVA